MSFQRAYLDVWSVDTNKGQIQGVPPNPRFIKNEKFKKLVESMKQDPDFLEIREIAVYDLGADASPRFVCIGGNMRFLAAKELKMVTIPCKIVPTGYDVERIRRFILKDNSSFGETDWDILLNSFSAEEIEGAAIDIPDIDVPTETEAEKAKDDHFDVEANIPKTPTAKTGDVYELGEHRLICGDSTDARYINALMDGKQADLLITDPPYNVNYHAKTGSIQNDNQEFASFVAFLTDAFRNAKDVLRDGGAFYIWFAQLQSKAFIAGCEAVGLQIREYLIWVKSGFTSGHYDYHLKHEPCLYGWKDGRAHYFVNQGNHSTVLEAEQPDFEKMSKTELKDFIERLLSETPTTVLKFPIPQKNIEHPTMKPIPLIGYLIANSSRRGQTVLDIFGGSGTTLIASEQLERRCFMVEKEPKFVDVIIKRWEEMTGKTATLVGNINEKTE